MSIIMLYLFPLISSYCIWDFFIENNTAQYGGIVTKRITNGVYTGGSHGKIKKSYICFVLNSRLG